MKKKISLMLLMIITIIITSGCAPGDDTYTKSDPANFFSGVWHGWIAPVTLIISLFNPQIRIYEPNNVGWLYDLGYYLAIASGFGGLSFTRSRFVSKS